MVLYCLVPLPLIAPMAKNKSSDVGDNSNYRPVSFLQCSPKH